MKQRIFHGFLKGLVIMSAWLTGCTVEPELHLYRSIDIQIPNELEVRMASDVMWKYEFDVDWEVEWQYGWDMTDSIIFGDEIGYRKPSQFELRRYYLGSTPSKPHSQVESFHLDGGSFMANYEFGYYDMLLWSSIITDDGIQSIIIDERDPDNVTAQTNLSNTRLLAPASASVYSKVAEIPYYEPEELFSLYMKNIHISADTADYEYYDSERRVYYKKIEGVLQPIVYIYLPQLILYHNNGRISAVDGNAVLTGMALRTSVNTGITENEAGNVYFHDRMKRGVMLTDGEHKGETADVIGGRLQTFGICNTNPNEITRAVVADVEPHYIGFNVQFSNGVDSILVFDVTDEIRERYRGGVITMELDVDSLPIPEQQGGRGFDAHVAECEEETYEFGI